MAFFAERAHLRFLRRSQRPQGTIASIVRGVSIIAAFAVGLSSLMAACSVMSSFDGLSCGDGCGGTDGALDVTKVVADGSDPTEDGSVLSTPDGGMPVDASMGNPDTGTPSTDSGPQPRQYLCTGTMTKTTDCSTCAGASVPCLLCGSAGNDHSKVVGVCVTNATSSACEGKGPAGFDDCVCNVAPTICPESFSVCAQPSGPACRTCGFDGSAGLPCKGGGTCNVMNQCK